MAKRIAIAGSREHLKKSVALLWVRRGMADWVVPGSVIARRAAKTSIPVDIRFELQAAPEPPAYIPEHLPSAEIPGLRFKPSEAMTKARLQSRVSQIHLLPRVEQQANIMAEL